MSSNSQTSWDTWPVLALPQHPHTSQAGQKSNVSLEPLPTLPGNRCRNMALAQSPAEEVGLVEEIQGRNMADHSHRLLAGGWIPGGV